MLNKMLWATECMCRMNVHVRDVAFMLGRKDVLDVFGQPRMTRERTKVRLTILSRKGPGAAGQAVAGVVERTKASRLPGGTHEPREWMMLGSDE
jgi:hypothetical protein